MTIEQVEETFQLSSASGTVSNIYTCPAGKVFLIQKLLVINTDPSASATLNLWIDPDGGTSALLDKNHFYVEQTIGAEKTVTVPATGRNIPPGGTLAAEVADAAGTADFTNKVNITLSGNLIEQSTSATGTSA